MPAYRDPARLLARKACGCGHFASARTPGAPVWRGTFHCGASPLASMCCLAAGSSRGGPVHREPTRFPARKAGGRGHCTGTGFDFASALTLDRWEF